MRLGSGADAISFMPAAALALGVLVVGMLIGALPLRAWPWLAVIVYGVSITALLMIGLEPLAAIGSTGDQPSRDVLLMAPTIAFGFLLCPYLDLTFHRAVQESPSRHSFAVFGVAFAVMLILTATYRALSRTPIDELFGIGSITGRLVIAHLFAQMLFTIGAHSRELRVQRSVASMLRPSGALVLPLLGLVPIALGAVLHWSYAMHEQMYVRWLVFYGLIFPAYVLVFIGPWRAKRMTMTNLGQLAVALIAFIPLFELGFMHHWTAALLPPVVLLMLWVLITPGTAARRS
jgi:hypothetical protein